MGNHGNRIALFAVVIGLALAASINADDYRSVDLQESWGPDNVRAVQEKLRDSGLYFGEIDGVYSSELAAALGRYQIRNGLPMTGQQWARLPQKTGNIPCKQCAYSHPTKHQSLREPASPPLPPPPPKDSSIWPHPPNRVTPP